MEDMWLGKLVIPGLKLDNKSYMHPTVLPSQAQFQFESLILQIFAHFKFIYQQKIDC